MAGCAQARPALVIAPPVVTVACPEPGVPALPLVNGTAPFEGMGNLAVFMERDDMLRSYIRALRRTLACYAMQTKESVHAID